METVIYTSPFVPAEWIAAHGFAPERFCPRAVSERTAAVSLSGVCPYARAVADEMSGRRKAAGIIIATTCDQMRRAAELASRGRSPPVFLMNVPSTWQTAAARRLYLEELRRLGRFLEQLGGAPPSNDRLLRTMRKQDLIRSHRRLAASASNGIPVMLIGGPLFKPHEKIFDLIKSHGGCVAVDGTETGERTWPASFNMVRARRNSVAELARAYFGTIPDAFRRPDRHLHHWLKRTIRDRAIRGIICIRHVWCDLWHAEVHRIKEWVRVPLLDLDLDVDARIDSGRTVSRIQAFLETLR